MYKRYGNLLFFDKNGKSFDLKYENDRWTGKIHIPPVAINLYENFTIYIIERFIDPTGNTVYGTPHIYNTVSNLNIDCKLQTGKEFRLFTVDNPSNPTPALNFQEKLQFTFENVISDTIDYVSGDITTSNFDGKLLRIDFCVASPIEGIFVDKLLISDNSAPFIEIELYTEIEGEDERFNVLLSNMGEYFLEKDEYIFKESDINEDLPNYSVINRKRKELLIELHNIKPYLSSYRGIINIIKFFGYYNIKLKEYWLNKETSKYFYEDVVLDEHNRLDERNQLRKAPYKKTSYFGLFYEINQIVQNEYDELGLPILENTGHFSFEEVIIKLFGLQNYIIEHNIGGLARIMDLIGEHTGFVRYDINYWHDRTTVSNIDLTGDIEFSTDKTQGYIIDLRPLINDYSSCPLPRNLNQTNGDVQIGTFSQCFLGWFDNLHMDDPEYLDDRFVKVGCPVLLQNKSFNVLWSMLGFSWNHLSQSNITLTWDTISHPHYYEIEWIVERNVNTSSDRRPWKYGVRGQITDLNEYGVIFPFDGYYDVTLILHGWNNNTIRLTKKSHIKVELKEADFISFYKIKDKRLQRFSGNYLTWDEIKSEWGSTIFDNEQFLIGDNDIQDRSFHVTNFINSDALNVPFVGINSEKWSDYFGNVWADFAYVTWSDFTYTREKLARFQIIEIQANGKLQVGVDTIILPDNINIHDFVAVAEFLNLQTGVDVSSFNYIARSLDGTSFFIDATSVNYGHHGNRFVGGSGGVVVNTTDTSNIRRWVDCNFPWQDMQITWESFPNVYRAVGLDNLFTWDNVNIYKDSFFVPICVRVQFVIDNSAMPGKTYTKWTVINDNTGEILVDNMNIFSLAMRFKEVGNYTIGVVIEDTNGNINKVEKKRHVRVIDSNEWYNQKTRDKILNKRKSVFSSIHAVS